MKRVSRRALVAAVPPVVAGMAGCLDATDDGLGGNGTGTRSSNTATDESTGATTSDDGGGTDADAPTQQGDGRTVRLVSARTSRAIVTLLAGTHPSVTADADRQYVVVELDVSGDDAQSAAEDACELRVDEDVVEPIRESVQPFTDGVHLAFALGLDVGPETVSLAWVGEAETVEFPLPESVAASLAAPPAFEVRSFQVPPRADGDEVEVSFTVANVGEGDGEFLAELGSTAVSDQGELRVAVAAGETKTVTRSVGLVPSASEQVVVLDWGSAKLERTVQVPTTTE